MSGCTAANPNHPLPIDPSTWRDLGQVFCLSVCMVVTGILQNSSEEVMGLAILVVTLLVRFLILPLMVKQMKSSKRMQDLQPELTKLKEKHKNDPQKAQQEMIKLYQVE